MARRAPVRFSVMPEQESEAIAHLAARGIIPAKVEKGDDGFVYLIFSSLPDDQMLKLAQALPVHLSAKVGFVLNGQPPFIAHGNAD